MVFDNDQVLCDLHINELLGIDNSTVSINGVHDPIINACFINDENIFVNLFHKSTETNWHFKYSYKDQSIIGQAVATHLNCSQLNFPINNFYDFEHDQVYCFYRHGESITVNLNDLAKVRTQTIVTESLGQMYFIYNKILVANSSDTVLFFKRVGTRNDDNSMTYFWEKYHEIEKGGFIYFIKGNTQIQITTERLVYFYRIDEETLMPIIENCMYNFMNCSQMMYGSASRYCVTYKTGQIGFNIYRRKYFHKYMVRLCDDCFDSSRGLSINSKEIYMISFKNKIRIYD